MDTNCAIIFDKMIIRNLDFYYLSYRLPDLIQRSKLITNISELRIALLEWDALRGGRRSRRIVGPTPRQNIDRHNVLTIPSINHKSPDRVRVRPSREYEDRDSRDEHRTRLTVQWTAGRTKVTNLSDSRIHNLRGKTSLLHPKYVYIICIINILLEYLFLFKTSHEHLQIERKILDLKKKKFNFKISQNFQSIFQQFKVNFKLFFMTL